MSLRLNSLVVFLPGLLVSFLFTGDSLTPPCLVRPDHLQLNFPRHGFKWAEGAEPGNGCEDVPAGKWSRQPSGPFDLLVYADGPSGSGRYWKVMIGITKRSQSKPIRGICLITSTVGWRTLQQWKKTPLAWLDDLDGDGESELIIWNSFPLREEASMAEFGLMAWVYRVNSANSVAIDWHLSRKMAKAIAVSYRSTLESTTTYSGLRTQAAEALEQFGGERCRMTRKASR